MFGIFRKKDATPPDPFVKADDNNVFRLRVKTNRFGEMVELRFTKSADISHDDSGGYVFRKAVVSSGRFDRGEVTVKFDSRYKVLEVVGEGVTPIARADWEK